MSDTEEYRAKAIAKFKPFIDRGEGGIFITKTRKRLSGALGLSGRGRTINDFWFDVRRKVKNALKDIELFLKCADKDQIDQVLTHESLEPVVHELLSGLNTWDDYEPNPKRAEAAHMFIEWGFKYLRDKGRKSVTLSHNRTFKEALDLSDFILASIKGTPYYTPDKRFEVY